MEQIDFGKIIKRSWDLTWKNKWLWVVGIVLTASGGSGFSGSGGGSSSNSASPDLPGASPRPFDIESIRNETNNVLGVATDAVGDWFSSIPPEKWMFFGLGVLVFILFSIAIAWVLKSWATGALITGMEDADLGKEVNLKTLTPQGLRNIKNLIMLGIISSFMFITLYVVYLLLLGIGFGIRAIVPLLGNIWIGIFGVVGVLIVIVLSVIFAMLTVYSERLIVLKGYSPLNAWKKAFKLTKGNFLPTAIMGIINGFLGCLAGCAGTVVLLIALAIPGIILIMPIFKDGFTFPSVPQIIGILILLTIFITVSRLISAVLVVFNAGNWNQIFKIIMSKDSTLITEDTK